MTAGVAVIDRPWDSELWGRRSGRIEIEDEATTTDLAAALDAAQRDFEFLQLLVPASRVEMAQWAERAGFSLVDTRCILQLVSPPTRRDADAGAGVTVAGGDDLAAIAELAATCHLNSRFGNDPALPSAKVAELYRRWIHRDAALPGWMVAMAGTRHDLSGYISFGRTAGSDRGSIGLIGVSPPARGRGVGHRLVRAAIDAMIDQGCAEVTVVTQGGSAAALALYQVCGFQVERLAYWLHWHRTQGAA